MIIIKLIATILIISFFCLCGNQLLWECNIMPKNIYERLHDILAHICAWLMVISVGICGIGLLVYMWTH